METNESTMIHVARDGKDLGVFAQEFASECLLKSVLHADDLAWTDGLAEWMRLGDLLGVEAEASAPAQPVNRLVRVVRPRLSP